jgi:hypothetical protein
MEQTVVQFALLTGSGKAVQSWAILKTLPGCIDLVNSAILQDEMTQDQVNSQSAFSNREYTLTSHS